MVSDAKQIEPAAGKASALPSEMASAVNLFAHPFAGAAAMSAVGIGLASHAFGLWIGTVSGMAEASRRMFAPFEDAPEEKVASTPRDRTASTRAKSATKVLIEDAQSAALEIAGVAVEPTAPAPVAVEAPADLQPEDFRQPRSMPKPRKPDDLKAISGIGPKLEKVLNDLGVWTHAQIAAWTNEEIAWVDDFLSFRGRIGRDDWTGQAARLSAKGKR